METLSLELISGILADFMNDIFSGEKFAFEKAVHALCAYTKSPEQEAMVRNSLYHLEIITENCDENFNLKGFVGLEANILLWTLAADWHCINTRTLGDGENFKNAN